MSTDAQRSVSTATWSDSWFEKQNPDVKLLWMYLLTHPKSNMLGIFEITQERTSFETRIPLERVCEGFETLLKDFKAVFAADYVWVVNFWSHQKYNDNMRTSARRIFEELPENVRFEFAGMGSKLTVNPWETLCNGLSIPLEKYETRNGKLEINTLSHSPAQARARVGGSSFELDTTEHNQAHQNAFDQIPEDLRSHPELAPRTAPQLPGSFEIPTLQKVMDEANMRGFTSDIAQEYYDTRQAAGWKVARGQGENVKMFPIADWRADLRSLCRKLQDQKSSKAARAQRPSGYGGNQPLSIAEQLEEGKKNGTVTPDGGMIFKIAMSS